MPHLRTFSIVAATPGDLIAAVYTSSRVLRGLGIRRRTIVATIVLAAIEGRLTLDPATPPGRARVTDKPEG